MKYVKPQELNLDLIVPSTMKNAKQPSPLNGGISSNNQNNGAANNGSSVSTIL
jgi:hypothetical protein